ERLSAETGCWLYLATAHPNAHSAFTNYTSQRLVQERSLTLLDDLHNTAHKMFHVLKVAHRSNAQELASDLHAATEQLAQSQSEATGMRAELDRLSKENQRKDELIRCLHDLQSGSTGSASN
ncbi:hypothetical protein BDP27DRAFT_1236172, partial [Rhodocollybia butyracea]